MTLEEKSKEYVNNFFKDTEENNYYRQLMYGAYIDGYNECKADKEKEIKKLKICTTCQHYDFYNKKCNEKNCKKHLKWEIKLV